MEDWLRSNGLGRYIPAFEAEGITADQLSHLTNSDLRELGLTMGDRKRFLAAIAAKPPPQPTAPVERRPLTVMFVDLAGSAAMGERLDVEDLMHFIAHYRDRCGTAIARYGGKIARFVGDGILAYFCYPIANENNSERAARAAMDIVRGMVELTTPDGEPVHVRIGLATGVVIVGDLVAGGETESLGVLGSTPNLAARLQSLAAPNGIVVAEQTHSRIRRRFDCERLTPIQLKGFAQTQQPWRIVQERMSRGSGSRRLGGSELTPLQGREAELDALRTLWRQAEQGQGRVALIVGEAGIGKSRLVTQFLNEKLPADAALVEINGSPFDTDSLLRPVIDFIQSEAGLTGTEDRDQALHRLRSVLAGDVREPEQAMAILAGLLGLPYREPTIAALTPEQLRERTIALLAEQIAARGRGGPFCILIEDLHWLDPSSCEVLALLIRMITDRPCLLLITAREGTAPTWLSRQATTTLQLGRLDALHTARLARNMLGSRAISPRLLEQIANRTDGVPLFIEEVVRGILERNLDALPEEALPGEAGREIPASLHESLIARLDRAVGARHIAQVAAVAGRSVRRDVLAAASGSTGEALDRALATLVASGILEQDLRAGADSYAFSHSLLRDAAYDSLLSDRRRELHEQVARALQRLVPELHERQPETLAFHLTAGGHAVEAAPLWLEAARNSLSRSALTEATRLLRRGLSALERLPQTTETMRLRLQLCAPLGAALMGLRGPFASETQDHYAAAYELCHALPEEEAHFTIYWGWWRVAPDYRAHLDRAASLLERAKARQDPALLLQAHHCSWAINFHIGALERCCEHMRAGLAHLRGRRLRPPRSSLRQSRRQGLRPWRIVSAILDAGPAARGGTRGSSLPRMGRAHQSPWQPRSRTRSDAALSGVSRR